MPFSGRLVHDSVTLLWPKSHGRPPIDGYELCGCTGCENKSWADHILKDDIDDEVSAFGNLHIDYERYQNENHDDDDDDDDEDGDR